MGGIYMIHLNDLYKYISLIDKVYEYGGFYYLFTVPIDDPNGSMFWKMKIGTDILELIEYADYAFETDPEEEIEVDPSIIMELLH